MLIGSIPTRYNSETIYASWFNDLKNAIIDSYGDGALITKTANYSALSTDSCIEIDASTSSVDIEIAEAVAGNKGKTYCILTKDITNNAQIVPITGSINGDGAFVFLAARQAVVIKSNGVEWVIVSNTHPIVLIDCFLTSPEVTDWLYIGDKVVNGSRRIGLVGTDLVTQERVLGVWTTSKTEGSIA